MSDFLHSIPFFKCDYFSKCAVFKKGITHLPKHTYFRVSVSDFVFFQDNAATQLAYFGKQSHAPVEALVLLTG